MSTVGSTSSSTSSSSSSSTGNSIQDLSPDQFLQLMLTELQNQDPLNPMDNTQILQEIGQMDQISASTKLTTTLDSVLLAQNLSSAGAMIGKNVTGLTSDGTSVSGIVSKVTVSGGTPQLTIGQNTISLTNIQTINPTTGT